MPLQRPKRESFNLEIVDYSVPLCRKGHFQKSCNLGEINGVGEKSVGGKPTEKNRRF